ncbi:MAG: PilZ domain-containing protein [Candidatus Eremiobacterota bacterium]
MLKWLLAQLFGLRKSKPGPDLWERRGDFRLRCALEATCQYGSTAVPARVVEIGPRGIRIESEQEFKPGEAVRVSCRPGGMLLGRQRLPYRVTWCRREAEAALVGAVLVQEALAQTWVEHVLRMAGALRRKMLPRRYFRAPLTAPARLADLTAKRLAPAQLRDISLQGALLATPHLRGVGKAIQLQIGPTRKLPAVEVAARVLTSRMDVATGERLVHLKFFGCSSEQVSLLERYVRTAIEAMPTCFARSS